jgi:hypothetical protein
LERLIVRYFLDLRLVVDHQADHDPQLTCGIRIGKIDDKRFEGKHRAFLQQRSNLFLPVPLTSQQMLA